jgi:hypothetical protein
MYISFFLHVHTRGGGRIQTSDLCFMSRSPQLIELSLEDNSICTLGVHQVSIKKYMVPDSWPFLFCFVYFFTVMRKYANNTKEQKTIEKRKKKIKMKCFHLANENGPRGMINCDVPHRLRMRMCLYV